MPAARSPNEEPAPHSSSKLRLKLCLHDRVKIFLVHPQHFPFSQLLSTVSSAFPAETTISSNVTGSIDNTSPPSINFELTYHDTDGDTIIIHSDESLSLALSSACVDNALKVHIRLTGPSGHHRGKPTQLGHSPTQNKYDVYPESSRASSRWTPSQRRTICRHFVAGSCKFGASCKFSHAHDHQHTNPRSDRDIEKWLLAQQRGSAHDTILYWSSDEGYKAVKQILNRTALPAKLIHGLVVLLSAADFRTSLLKKATDRLYNTVVDSAFLAQLHSHIRSTLETKVDSIAPYVVLTEELISRTDHGWKEVPLDELKTLVDNLEEDQNLTKELQHALSRMLELRAKKKRLTAINEKFHSMTLSTDFRSLPIIPAKEQLLTDDSEELPVNLIGLRYPSLAVYLDTHFRLMQEDSVATLRDGIRQLRRNSRDPNVHVYTNTRLAGIECGHDGIVYRVSFHCTGQRNLEASKHLMFGSLLCISHNNFQTFVWAVVAHRNQKLLAENSVDIRLLHESSDDEALHADRVYTMAESSAAYFEAYSHVLRNLQRHEMENFPFQEHLVSLEPQAREPSYLQARQNYDLYDFQNVFPSMKDELPSTCLHILQSWPEWTCSLDHSQLAALKHGLTKRLALIQGPPGTGKTFIGLLIVRIMLENLKNTSCRPRTNFSSSVFGIQQSQHPPKDDPQENGMIGGPILVVCYTNHALDQFLEAVYEQEENVVRIGGQSKSSELDRRKLQTLLKAVPHHERFSITLYSRAYQAEETKRYIREQIKQCTYLLHMTCVTEAALHGVATEEQIQVLFYEGCNSATVVQVWLNGREEVVQTDNVERDNSGDLRLPIRNMYDLLSEDVVDAAEENDFTIADELDESDDETAPCLTNGESSVENDAALSFDNVEISGRQDKMIKILPSDPQGLQCSSRNDLEDDEEWIPARARKSSAYRAGPSAGRMSDSKEVDMAPDHTQDNDWPLEELLSHVDLWSLNLHARRKLHDQWLGAIRKKAQDDILLLSSNYENACTTKSELDNEIQLSLLRKAKVVGMTTTAAARYHTILESLQAEIIIVEEAAEVLEGHILACLTASTKHLILIGDHLQLRPSVAVYKLAAKHKLDVSMFERLIQSGVEHVTLEVQRRMRPSISRLISSIYPMLKDHESVLSRENIKGVNSNVFFFHHQALEGQKGDDDSGKVNIEEANLVVELCSYLLKQGYKSADITILSMYKGQTQEIFRRLRRKLQGSSLWSDKSPQITPRISSVDDYQGEECDIIILSLVRSNYIPTKDGPGKIGFLNISNRVCVALSRARNGLFIFGNGKLLAEKSALWKTVIQDLQGSGSYGDTLVLACQNHPEIKTQISKVSDFQEVSEGGCNLKCEHQLHCGHVCPKRCHPGDHDRIVCPKRCPRKFSSCGHHCQSLCHGFSECPPCQELVTKDLPMCGHVARVRCSALLESIVCQHPCPKILPCRHECKNICGKACTSRCSELVERDLPCGHSAQILCHLDPQSYACKEPCKQNLPDCGHPCVGTCGTCKQGKYHVPCGRKCSRTLPCGHMCQSLCHQVCPPCSMPCRKGCIHSRCPKRCGDPCVPCVEQCEWSCKHQSCTRLCHEQCDRPSCDEPCEKILKCGHACTGLCGEYCPRVCRVCTPYFKESISQMQMVEFDASDRFIQLQDCGHVFEVSGLDTWMQLEQSEGSVKPKQCPQCRAPVWRSLRYGDVVKLKLQQIEEVKQRIYGFECVNKGIRCLKNKDYEGALEQFLRALERNVENFEAYFRLGCTRCLQSQFRDAIGLFHFVVQNSSLGSVAEGLYEGQQMSSLQALLDRLAGDLKGDFAKERRWSKEARFRVFQITVPKVLNSRAERSLAIKALTEWASALSSLKRFPDAIRACEVVLRENPDSKEASEILRLAQNNEVRSQVVAVMMHEVGGRGHWYQCPNGHYYVVGECGGPMQHSRCPDCKEVVGGESHRPARGNTHADIDGSSHSAWSNHTGLGGLNI